MGEVFILPLPRDILFLCFMPCRPEFMLSVSIRVPGIDPLFVPMVPSRVSIVPVLVPIVPGVVPIVPGLVPIVPARSGPRRVPAHFPR